MTALQTAAQFNTAIINLDHPDVREFRSMIADIATRHRPSRMPFFSKLAKAPRAIATSPEVLGRMHLIYQSAMHATRAAVYNLPHLDNPSMRKRKLQIFIDDDGLPGGDTHHYQLTRAFNRMGAKMMLQDEEFGTPSELATYLGGESAEFVRLVPQLYARSLGPWCIVEKLSDDWMRALAESLAVHFAWIIEEPYFFECFSQGVEERHAEESLTITEMVLASRPELLRETIRDARLMAMALDKVWLDLEKVLP